MFSVGAWHHRSLATATEMFVGLVLIDISFEVIDAGGSRMFGENYLSRLVRCADWLVPAVQEQSEIFIYLASRRLCCLVGAVGSRIIGDIYLASRCGHRLAVILVGLVSRAGIFKLAFLWALSVGVNKH